MPPKKILIISHLFPPHVGGVEYSAFITASYLAANSLDVTCIHAATKSYISDQNGFSSIGVRSLSIFKGLYPIAGFKFFYKLSKQVKNTNLVIIYGRHFTTSFLGMIACKIYQKPYIYIDTGFQPKIWQNRVLNLFTNLLDKYLLGIIPKGATKVVAISEFTQQNLIKLGVRPESITIIYNGFDSELLNKYNIQKKSNTVIYAGRWSKIKDPLTVFKAFLTLSSNYPNWKFEIYGKGENLIPAGDLKNLPKNMVVQNRNMPQTELWARLAESKIYINSSISEGMSLAVTEAAALGNVLVLSNNPGNNEVASNFVSNNVFKFTPGNDVELCEAIKNAIELTNHDALIYSKIALQAQVFESTNQLGKLAEMVGVSG